MIQQLCTVDCLVCGRLGSKTYRLQVTTHSVGRRLDSLRYGKGGL